MKGHKYRSSIVLSAVASLSISGPQLVGQASGLPEASVSTQSASDATVPAFDVIVVKPNKSGDRPCIDFDGGNLFCLPMTSRTINFSVSRNGPTNCGLI
jgi:hypothetical protein